MSLRPEIRSSSAANGKELYGKELYQKPQTPQAHTPKPSKGLQAQLGKGGGGMNNKGAVILISKPNSSHRHNTLGPRASGL